MKTQNEWQRRAKTTDKKQRQSNFDPFSSNEAVAKDQYQQKSKQHTLEQFFGPIMKRKSDSPKKTKTPNEKRFHDFIQPIMRFKPRLDLERILDEVNKHNYGRADRSILDKQLLKFDSNNLIVLNSSSEADKLDESMEHYLKYINSQNRIAIMKMIQDKTLDKIVKQFKKEEKDQKIINDNFENIKDGNTDRKNYSKNKKKAKYKNKINNDNLQEKKSKLNKFNYIDKSCAKDILKELHTKTYFNAANIIASNSKLIDIMESVKTLKIEEQLNNKDYEKSNGFKKFNKNLKYSMLEKNTKSSQDESSNNSFNTKTKLPQQNILNLGNNEKKKNSCDKQKINLILNTKNKKDSLKTKTEDSDEKTNIDNYLDAVKKNLNNTDNNFFKASKIKTAIYKSKHSILEKVISKFKNNFYPAKDDENQDFDENPLLYNPNFNHLRKKQTKAEEFNQEKLEYLRSLAFIENKKFHAKRFNNLSRYNIERNADDKKPEKEKESENLNDSDQDLLEINNELKNSLINHSNKNNNNSGSNPNCNISFKNEKSPKINKRNEKENDNIFGISNNFKDIYSPNGETVIKINDLAKVVVDKCNFVTKKHKNNNTKLATGNGKLMITSGLSVKDFIKKFNLKDK